MFAVLSTAGSFIRATDVLRKFGEDCGAQVPQSLRSTELRKHLATQSQVMNLADNEIETLADFTGHYKDIHRKFYQLPSDAMQISKITKILIATENGSKKSLGGKTLDAVEAKDLETLGQYFEDVTFIRIHYSHLYIVLNLTHVVLNQCLVHQDLLIAELKSIQMACMI